MWKTIPKAFRAFGMVLECLFYAGPTSRFWYGECAFGALLVGCYKLTIPKANISYPAIPKPLRPWGTAAYFQAVTLFALALRDRYRL